MKPPLAIANSICLNDCSGSGICVNGTCECQDGYITDDCSMLKGNSSM